MPSPKFITLKALKVKQPIGDFFVAVIGSADLLEIAYSDIRELRKEGGEVASYLGIQRRLVHGRVKEIGEYVKTLDATFPTPIILAIEQRCAEWDDSTGLLKIIEYKRDDSGLADQADVLEDIPYSRIAKILDGQHRLAGLEGYEGSDFQLTITIFIGADIAEQANIFSTVNLAQTKVNKSLVYDLFEYGDARSPQKTGHNIAVALNSNEQSPFNDKIKRLGVATEGSIGETLTQSTFVEALMPYISSDPRKDQDDLKRKIKLQYPSDEDLKKYIFRGLFIEERDVDITKIVWAYYDAVSERWPTAWESLAKGNILNRTNGFRAFMRFLRPVYLLVASPGELVGKKKFLEIFNKTPLNDSDFNSDRFHPGATGENNLYKVLLANLQDK